MEKFKYLKDGETNPSERTLHAVKKPDGLVRALDVSGLSEEEANKAARLYDQWLEEHMKPYQKLENDFKANNLESFDEFCRDNGIEKPPMVKSFKATGLTPA